MTPRGSLEVARSGAATPGSLSPYQSRRGSVLVAPGGEGGVVTVALSKEEATRKEKEKAEARTA